MGDPLAAAGDTRHIGPFPGGGFFCVRTDDARPAFGDPDLSAELPTGGFSEMDRPETLKLAEPMLPSELAEQLANLGAGAYVEYIQPDHKLSPDSLSRGERRLQKILFALNISPLTFCVNANIITPSLLP
jgi:hypothetical protein